MSTLALNIKGGRSSIIIDTEEPPYHGYNGFGGALILGWFMMTAADTWLDYNTVRRKSV